MGLVPVEQLSDCWNLYRFGVMPGLRSQCRVEGVFEAIGINNTIQEECSECEPGGFRTAL